MRRGYVGLPVRARMRTRLGGIGTGGNLPGRQPHGRPSRCRPCKRCGIGVRRSTRVPGSDRRRHRQPARLNDEYRDALAAMVENGPIPAVHKVVRWRIIDLCQWLWQEYEISVSKQTLSRELRAMGYRKLSARPRHHAQAAGAVEAFKKSGPRQWRQSRRSEASIPAT